MKVKTNIYENLQIIDFENIDELATQFLESCRYAKEMFGNNAPSVSIYGKSDFIYSIIKTIPTKGNFRMGAMNFRRGYFDDEESVFGFTVFDDGMFVVEKAYIDDGRPYHVEGIIYINQNDCEQDLIDRALEDNAEVTLFGFKEDDKTDERDVPSRSAKIKKLRNGVEIVLEGDEPYGIIAHEEVENHERYFSYWSDDVLTLDKIEEILKKHGF